MVVINKDLNARGLWLCRIKGTEIKTLGHIDTPQELMDVFNQIKEDRLEHYVLNVFGKNFSIDPEGYLQVHPWHEKGVWAMITAYLSKQQS